jgi:hydrogenase expression/formation protein HypC
MCLAVPMVLVKRDGDFGTVEVDGVQREVSLQLEPDAALGDYVLVHAGYAIGRVDPEEARITLEMLREIGATEEM